MLSAGNAGLRRKTLRSFKQRGYVVHVKALETVLSAFYDSVYGDDLQSFLEKIFDQLSRPGVTEDGIVTVKVAEEIAACLAQSNAQQEGNTDAAFQVIDIFQAPCWRSSTESKMLTIVPGPGVNLNSTGIAGLPIAKAQLFRLRYELMRNKTLRNPRFTPPASGLLSRAKDSPYLQLTGIESLAGTHDDKLVLGMLTQLEEGSWYLEDLHGSIKVDLSQAHVTAGFHTECSFVIAQGRHVETDTGESIFQISAMGTPPLEQRDDSLSALGKESSLFGGTIDSSQIPALMKMEKEDENAMILLLSEVALDSPRVIAGIRHILKGYLKDDVVPTIIVLMGSFLTHPFGQQADDLELLTSKFTQLGEVISSDFPEVAHSSAFVLVPSLSDPGPGNVLPRPPLPSIVTEGFEKALGSQDRVHLATNPCRMRYMSQELVFLREDLMHKMVRHCSIKPDMAESSLMSEHLIKSIVDQAHLTPLPLSARPTIWNRDRALWLFPTPHLVAIADKVESYTCKYGGALGLNPGSFATDFSFSVYLPAKRSAQQCSIDSERRTADEETSTEQLRNHEDDDDDDDDVGSGSDSGHSIYSLLHPGKRDSDDGMDSDDEIRIDVPPIEAQNSRKPPLNETGPVTSESENLDICDTDIEHPSGGQQNSENPENDDALTRSPGDQVMEPEQPTSQEQKTP